MLENSATYRQVFLRSSEDHPTRLLKMNCRKLLEITERDKDYKLTANGRIIKKGPEASANAASSD